MFFRRKGWLRGEFDEKLIKQFSDLKETGIVKVTCRKKVLILILKWICKRN